MQIHLSKFCNIVLLSVQFSLQQACMNGDYTWAVQLQGLWDIHAKLSDYGTGSLQPSQKLA